MLDGEQPLGSYWGGDLLQVERQELSPAEAEQASRLDVAAPQEASSLESREETSETGGSAGSSDCSSDEGLPAASSYSDED